MLKTLIVILLLSLVSYGQDGETCVNRILNQYGLKNLSAKAVIATAKNLQTEETKPVAEPEAAAVEEAHPEALVHESMLERAPMGMAPSVAPRSIAKSAVQVKAQVEVNPSDESQRFLQDFQSLQTALFGDSNFNRPLPTIDHHLVVPLHAVGVYLKLKLTDRAMRTIVEKRQQQERNLATLTKELSELKRKYPQYKSPVALFLVEAYQQQGGADARFAIEDAARTLIVAANGNHLDTIRGESELSYVQSAVLIDILPWVLQEKPHEKSPELKAALINLFCAIFSGKPTEFSQNDLAEIRKHVSHSGDLFDDAVQIDEMLGKVGRDFGNRWKTSQTIYWQQWRQRLGYSRRGLTIFGGDAQKIIPPGFLNRYPDIREGLIARAKKDGGIYDHRQNKLYKPEEIEIEGPHGDKILAASTLEWALIDKYILRDEENLANREERWKAISLAQEGLEIKEQIWWLRWLKVKTFMGQGAQWLWSFISSKKILPAEGQQLVDNMLNRSVAKTDVKAAPVEIDSKFTARLIAKIPKGLVKNKKRKNEEKEEGKEKEEISSFHQWTDLIEKLAFETNEEARKMYSKMLGRDKNSTDKTEAMNKLLEYRQYVLELVLETITEMTNQNRKDKEATSWDDAYMEATLSFAHHMLREKLSVETHILVMEALRDYRQLGFLGRAIDHVMSAESIRVLDPHDTSFLGDRGESTRSLILRSIFLTGVVGVGATYAVWNIPFLEPVKNWVQSLKFW